jgi:NAD-dependent SIR2 family protein deacetylase
MGLNINLVEMLGLPEEVACPKCHNKAPTRFDDYDIDCGNPFPEPGKVSLHMYCQACEHEWYFEGRLTFTLDEDHG